MMHLNVTRWQPRSLNNTKLLAYIQNNAPPSPLVELMFKEVAKPTWLMSEAEDGSYERFSVPKLWPDEWVN